ncbi:MAG: hypothetical protein ACPLW7_06295, partial [Minisyncoccia bacterium]
RGNMNLKIGDIIIYEDKKFRVSKNENMLVLEDMLEKGTIYYLDIVLSLWNKDKIKIINEEKGV